MVHGYINVTRTVSNRDYLRFLKKYFFDDYLLFAVGEEDRILRLLEKLEKLRKAGLIDDEYYQEKRNALLSKYLESKDEMTHVIEEQSQSRYSDRGERIYKALLISLLVIGIMLLGIVIGSRIYPSVSVITYTTSVFIERPITVTREYIYTATQTVEVPVIFYNQTYAYEEPLKFPTEKIVYSGSLSIEQDCQARGFAINAEKGDVIEVYWEADDDDAYVAIGTPAQYTENTKGYCEVMISFWKFSWPAADYGYSGTLRFTIPSSGTWYVILANGNYHCIFSNCPITFTKLEIKHIRS